MVGNYLLLILVTLSSQVACDNTKTGVVDEKLIQSIDGELKALRESNTELERKNQTVDK